MLGKSAFLRPYGSNDERSEAGQGRGERDRFEQPLQLREHGCLGESLAPEAGIRPVGHPRHYTGFDALHRMRTRSRGPRRESSNDGREGGYFFLSLSWGGALRNSAE